MRAAIGKSVSATTEMSVDDSTAKKWLTFDLVLDHHAVSSVLFIPSHTVTNKAIVTEMLQK